MIKLFNIALSLLSLVKSTLDFLIPDFLLSRTDTERFSIAKFIEYAAKKIEPSTKVLDAGAGSCPYKKYFSHTNYESTDFSSKRNHTFLCSLDKIPKPDNSYDAIINTQVLEHVEYPQKVINEFYRVLKPGGQLFLTAPQGWGIHEAPHHYFNFTHYGLESLFKHAGLKIISIKPRGGIFWYLGKRIKIMPDYIFSQYLYDNSNGVKKLKPKFSAFILFPFYIIALPICSFLIPLVFFYLDILDKNQNYTLGYACHCVKK